MRKSLSLRFSLNKGVSQLLSYDLRVMAILGLLMGFASISTDLYLPAIPAMGRSFQAEEGLIALTISGYLAGFSLGQLAWGPVSDRYGRRGVVAIGLVLFIIASAGCAFSGNLMVMIGWRVLQALGACAGVALSRAMVRDLYSGDRAARTLSTLMTIMAVAPLAGPLLGGQILVFAGWRAIFWLMAVIGAVALLSIFRIPETLPVSKRERSPLATAITKYGQLLGSRRLLGYVLIGGFFYLGMFAYVAGTPSVYISYYHVPVQYYGFLFGLGIVGIMIANVLNLRLIPKLGYERVLLIGVLLCALSAIITATTSLTGWGGLWGLVSPLFFFISTSGFVVANSITGALDDFPEQAGAVSALIGAFQYGSGIIGSALVGMFTDGSPWALGIIVGFSGIGCLVSMILVSPEK